MALVNHENRRRDITADARDLEEKHVWRLEKNDALRFGSLSAALTSGTTGSSFAGSKNAANLKSRYES